MLTWYFYDQIIGSYFCMILINSGSLWTDFKKVVNETFPNVNIRNAH